MNSLLKNNLVSCFEFFSDLKVSLICFVFNTQSTTWLLSSSVKQEVLQNLLSILNTFLVVVVFVTIEVNFLNYFSWKYFKEIDKKFI